MTSFKQIEANRRNALKSTGPTTDEGKQRSRCNAVRHGLTAETVIASIEDAEDYQAFESTVTADYDVETAVERELVLRLASILWRLRRATNIETAVFETAIAEPDTRAGASPPAVVSRASDPPIFQLVSEATEQVWEKARAEKRSRGAGHEIGDRFLRLAALPTFPLDRLSRYEHILWQQARQIIFALEPSYRRTRPRQRFPFSFGGNSR